MESCAQYFSFQKKWLETGKATCEISGLCLISWTGVERESLETPHKIVVKCSLEKFLSFQGWKAEKVIYIDTLQIFIIGYLTT